MTFVSYQYTVIDRRRRVSNDTSALFDVLYKHSTTTTTLSPICSVDNWLLCCVFVVFPSTLSSVGVHLFLDSLILLVLILDRYGRYGMYDREGAVESGQRCDGVWTWRCVSAKVFILACLYLCLRPSQSAAVVVATARHSSSICRVTATQPNNGHGGRLRGWVWRGIAYTLGQQPAQH